jgi:lipopolysaccharide transport system ATP-binding protein
MTDVAIHCEGLAKQYWIGERESYKALRDVITNAFASPLRRVHSALSHSSNGSDEREKPNIWALKDVSFEIKRGEVVGIIGRNGAGKSTLLKILSRITEPTQGTADIWGRIGSLLEVGTGFHPELTGRDNIFLNGAILGMKKTEITRKFDEIVAFAELEKFIDTPVKRYSSGMYMRLAFSVAAHLEPDILLVDEVLAVGDTQFQKKCLNKMEDVGQEGRTVILVSHNMNAIQRLCHTAIWLDNGTIEKRGAPSVVVGDYLKAASTSLTEIRWEDPAVAPGNDVVRLRSATIRPSGGQPSDRITVRTDFLMEFEYWNLKAGAYLNLSVHVLNDQGICVFNTGPAYEPVWNGKPFPKGLFRSVCCVPADLMNEGMHRIQLLVVQNQGFVIFRHDDLLCFDIHEEVEMGEGYFGDWPGAVRPKLEWTTELLDHPLPARRMEIVE